ncbi:MAG: FKBP-type peptidyl-prolyl cis-trans isomerase [Spirosomataceae bacterium]
MNKYFKITSIVAIAVVYSFSSAAQTIVPLKTSVDSLSYAIGVNVGENLKRQGVNANVEVFAQAIKDVLASRKLVISTEESNNFIQSYFEKEFARKANANKTAGAKFLAENKVKPGIMTTASGLQYQILVAGTGEKPTSADRVKVHYQGSLLDGTIFDSSIKRGEPTTFGVTQVISGWVEALQLMPVGSKWKLFIPSELAYGPQGPPSIGPDQLLIFEVELLEIVR